MEDPNSDVRRRAADALGKLNSEEAIPALIKALEDPNSFVRGRAAAALGNLNNSEEAIPALIKALEDLDLDVRWSAADALGKLNSEEAIPALIKALEDPDSYVRGSAADTLGNLNSEEAIPALIKALEHPDSDIRGSATAALEKMSNPRPLENLWEVQLSATSLEAYSAIATIQARCKFYNYEIFQAALEPENLQTSENRETTAIVYQIDTVGNLNTGTVNVKGDQIGTQHNSGLGDRQNSV